MQMWFENWLVIEIDVAVRFAIVFAISMIAALFLRSNPHRLSALWRLSMLSLLLLPLWSLMLPRVDIVIPIEQATSSEDISARVERDRPLTNELSNNFSRRQFADPSNAAVAPESMRLSEPQPIAEAVSLVPSVSTVERRAVPWKAIIFGTWAIVTCVFLLRTFYAIGRIRFLHLTDGPLEHANQQFYECPSVSSPVVAGVFRPKILLPSQWRQWSPKKLAAILAHETAHIKRRDPGFAFLVELLNAFYWFHPCFWIAKNQLRNATELACDFSALRDGHDRCEYARVLLDVARPAQKQELLHLAMARRGHIRQRITRILGETVAANLGFTTRDRLKLAIAGGCGLALLGMFTPTLISKDSEAFQNNSYSVDQWYAKGAEGPNILLHGVILNPDGSICKNASFTATTAPGDTYGNIINVIDFSDGRFEVQTNGLSVVYLRCSTEGRKLLGSLTFGPDELRRAAEQDVVVQLQPCKDIEFSVANLSKLDGRCTFLASSFGISQRVEADEHGRAQFSIYEDSDIDQVVCWTESKRIGYRELRGYRGLNPNETSIPIVLTDCSPVSVTVRDANGKAIAGETIEATVIGKDVRVSTRELSTVRTDANGLATFDLIPSIEGLRIYLKIDGLDVPFQPLASRSIVVTKPTKTDDHQQIFKGHVDLPADCPGGLFLRGGSFESPVEGQTTTFVARCDRNGDFQALVTPGYTYELSLNDNYWVSPCWTGILIGTNDRAGNPFKLAARQGTKVNIKVTGGKDNTPVRGRYVQMESPAEFSWIQDGKKQYGSGGRQWTLTSDANGNATTYAIAGELKAYCFSGKAYRESVVSIVEGQPNNIEIHFDVVGDQTVAGKLLGTNEVIGNASIEITQADSATVEKSIVVQSAADGTFEVKTDSNQAIAYATSQDHQFSGACLFTPAEGKVEIQMKASGSVSGQVLQAGEAPVIDGDITMVARMPNPKYQPGLERVSEEIIVHRYETKTDQNGNFKIAAVPAGVKLSLWLSTGPSTGRFLDQISLEPSENRSTVYPDASRRDVSFESRYSEILGDTKLSHTRALIVISGTGEQAKRFTVEHALSYDEHRDVLWYLPALFDMTTLPTMPDRQAVFNRHAWPTPEENSLWLLVMNDKDEEVGRIHLNVADQARYDESLAAFERFIRDHRVDQLNAETLLDQTLAEANQTDRTVWLSVGQTRCNPCFTLARWQDQHLAILTKAFVILKIDEIRDLHGADLAKRLKASGGIPWHVMLAPDGQPIINSESPALGNIGSPDRSRNSMEHFREMLQKGARGKLTDEEIETLVDSVPN